MRASALKERRPDSTATLPKRTDEKLERSLLPWLTFCDCRTADRPNKHVDVLKANVSQPYSPPTARYLSTGRTYQDIGRAEASPELGT
jgi:hypothetical protein